MTRIPPWADEELSKLAAEARATGEGQQAEFKEDFSQQAHHLAKEVAAFATSGGGLILIGVKNNGDVKGLEADSEHDRDELIHRAQGIIRQLCPSVKYQLAVASADSKPILAIRILGSQDEPVFYYDCRPYIRDGRTSRPATPDEVKAAIHQHPTAEYQRRREELNLRQAEQMIEGQRKLVEQSRSIWPGRST